MILYKKSETVYSHTLSLVTDIDYKTSHKLERRWPSGRVLAYRAQGHEFNLWPSHT